LAKNEEWLEKNGDVSVIHRRKPKGRPMSETTSRANGRRSRIRTAIEHAFARPKGSMALLVRTIGIVRAEVKSGMANLAFNLSRLVWQQVRSAPA
jgi:IS5 family transposase